MLIWLGYAESFANYRNCFCLAIWGRFVNDKTRVVRCDEGRVNLHPKGWQNENFPPKNLFNLKTYFRLLFTKLEI